MTEQKLWQTDEEFEALLRESLSAVQPPADFSERVMRAVRLEAAAADLAEPEPKRGVLRLPWRRWTAGVGSCAAAVLLFCAVAGPVADAPTGLPFGIDARTAQNIRTAALLEQPQRGQTGDPVIEPDTTGSEVEPVAANTNGATQTPVIRQPEASNVLEEPLIQGAGELVLPRAAYGTVSQGALSVRLLATVEDNAIYAPSVSARGNSAAFYTVDEQNVYTWRVDLAEASLPEVTAVTPRGEDDSPLTSTAPRIDATTLVKSPDGTMLAQNSREGVWVSLAEGDLFLLTEEGAGRLMTWSPDSSKLLFTNADGALFVGYPLERRIYQVTDLAVKDICWSEDNKTVVFQTEVDGQDCLYIVRVV